ncbi:MAG: VOC family protein [Pseudomonadota bacterium]
MIVPNLAVSDVARSVAFYRDVVGLKLMGAVTADRQMVEHEAGTVFAIMVDGEFQLMLQQRASLAEDADNQAGVTGAPFGGTVYFRDLDPDAVLARAKAASVIKGPEQQWYGMREVMLRDPDGHVVCIGKREGPAPE